MAGGIQLYFFGWLGWGLFLGVFFGFFGLFVIFFPSHARVRATAPVIYYACLKCVAFTVFLILFCNWIGHMLMWYPDKQEVSKQAH